MSPDEAIFRAHFASPAFQDGLDRGRWGLYESSETWPHVILWVPADQAVLAAGRLYLRFDLERYPQQAPTACPWDIEHNTALPRDKWPKHSGSQPNPITQVFGSSWSPVALYAPCDRVAMRGHDVWAQQHPDLWWQPRFSLVVYLDFVHGILNRQKYALA